MKVTSVGLLLSSSNVTTSWGAVEGKLTAPSASRTKCFRSSLRWNQLV